jgi:hypothetical protein
MARGGAFYAGICRCFCGNIVTACATGFVDNGLGLIVRFNIFRNFYENL